MVAGTDGDADTAGDLVAPVTDKDAAFFEGVADFDGSVTGGEEDEVALALDVRDAEEAYQ